MKKKMKVVKKVLAGVLAVVMAMSMIGCGKKDTVSSDEKTLNVRVYRAGYGDDYIRAWAAAFESLYAEEGYKINIVSSDSSLTAATVMTEMLLGENNGIDLYFAGSLGSDQLVQNSRENDMDITAADLTDVYQSKPIKADGTEEDVKIIDKFKEGYVDLFYYHGEDEEAKGKIYTYGVSASPCGFFFNEELLKSYDLEVPNTTDELIHCFQVIQKKQEETGVYPTAWAGLNAFTYWYAAEDVWAAQYDGIEAYQQFLSLQNPKKAEEGWKVYESQGWRESLDALAQVVHLDYAADKTISMDHTTAQHNFLSEKAVFMINGAWLQNEMAANYLEQAKKIKMMRMPVISALGVKLGLDGNGGKDAAKCEKVLTKVIDLIDTDKTDDAIVKEIGGITKAQVAAVRDARNLHYDWASGGTVINAFSTKIDIAKLFLRFIASDDAMRLYYDYASGFSALKPTTDIGYETDSEFWNSVYEISEDPDSRHFYRYEQGWRTALSMPCFSKYTAVEKELATAKGQLTGEQIMDAELAYAKETFTQRFAEYHE